MKTELNNNIINYYDLIKKTKFNMNYCYSEIRLIISFLYILKYDSTIK